MVTNALTFIGGIALLLVFIGIIYAAIPLLLLLIGISLLLELIPWPK
jgi:Na+-transporting methylmalonyl-CoA/oxaloacetate decarboxylase beta subunit